MPGTGRHSFALIQPLLYLGFRGGGVGGGGLETVMTGDTADIIIISDHAWYDWIEFYDPVGKHFPEENIYIGRYLGTATDVGSILIANILKTNGEMVYRSAYCFFLPEEINNKKEIRCQFDVMIEEEKLCPKAIANDFGEIGLEETPKL